MKPKLMIYFQNQQSAIPLTLGLKTLVRRAVEETLSFEGFREDVELSVTFTDNVELVLLRDIGPKIEHNKAFSGRVNVEFISKVGDNELRMRVWERGSGETQACGTGACASAAAAVSKGFCRAGKPIKVHLDGGDLEITVKEDFTCLMRGPAEFVSEGEIEE